MSQRLRTRFYGFFTSREKAQMRILQLKHDNPTRYVGVRIVRRFLVYSLEKIHAAPVTNHRVSRSNSRGSRESS